MNVLRISLLALVLGGVLLFTGSVGATTTACSSASKLVPTLRDVTINQGLQTYSTLARGKETLVRLYLSLPSCAVSGNAVRIDKVTLNVSLKDSATGAAVGLVASILPTPTLGTPTPQITNLNSSPMLTQLAPSDPVFVVPGATLAPSGDTNRLTATFSASIDWTPISPSGSSVKGTALTSTAAGTSMSKTVEKATRALRLLVVPLGGLLDAAGAAAIQNGMTTLSRVYPVPDGTGGSGIRVGSLTGTDGGIRYGINGSYLDLSALGMSLPFCGTATNFGSSTSGLIDTQLSQFRQSWNSANVANPNLLADNVVGAIGENQSTGSATSPNCDEARAAVNGREAWVRAVSDKTTTLSGPLDLGSTTLPVASSAGFPATGPYSVLVDNEVMNVTAGFGTSSWTVTRGAAASHALGATVTLLSATGALLAMEIEHNYGYVPPSRGDANFHSLYAHADHTTGDANRGYNVSGRQFLPDNRSNMRFTPPGWTNLNVLLEPPDWADMLCNLGGATTSECSTAGTTGTVSGTAAGLTDPPPVQSFVMSGTTDGTTKAGTDVLESYVATTMPTPIDSSSPYRLVQLAGGTKLRDDTIPVNFNVSNHNDSEPVTQSSVGLFSVAVPFATGATRIEFRNGSGTVLYSADKQSIPPTITPPAVIGFRTLSAQSGSPVRSARTKVRKLAANGDQLRQITADQSGTGCVAKSVTAIGVGIAFDGANLLLSCEVDNTISVVSPADGHQLSHYTVTGLTGTLGALAWDNKRHVIWACDGEPAGEVGTVDPTTHVFTAKFSVPGCRDGLAYDNSDDTIWTSPDATDSVTHSSTTGTVLGTFSGFSLSANDLAGGNSGIAVGGSTLYLANDGGGQIYTSAKDFSTAPALFTTLPADARAEDMECDNVTFAGQGKAALWSVDAYDLTLNAWEIPNGSCNFGGGGPTIDYTVNSSGSAYSDIYLKCPGSTVFNVIRVGIIGNDVSVPQPVGCSGGEFYAEAYDGFSSSGAPTEVAPSTLVNPPTPPFQASVTSPAPGQAYSVNEDVSLLGSAFDYSTGTPATLKWFDGTTQIASGQEADVRASTLTIGQHVITLKATSGDKTSTVDVPITISNDADGDGVPAPREDVIQACAISKGITDGGDTDPANGAKDYDNDGIPNRDDPFPCTPSGSYNAASAAFVPNPISLSGSGALSAGGILLPFRNMTQVIQPKGGAPSVYIASIGLGEQGTIPVNEQASNWIANGSIGAASFGRQPLIGILGTNHLANRSITLTITGNAVDPLSGPWNFTAVVSVFVSN